MPRDLKTVIEAVLDGVIVLDASAQVELLNAEACRILETSDEAARGLPVDRMLGADHPIAKLARGVLDSGRPAIDGERRIARRPEEELVVDVAASPLFDDRRRTDGVVLVLRDRTIQRVLEQVVSQREQLETFGRMATGIAHEVKNPLSGIRGAAELLAARASDDKARTTAQLIVREVDRIAALVDELMVFTRGEDLQLAPVNIHRVLDGVLQLVAHDPLASRVEVERAFDPSIPEFAGDADRLTQVFLNLVRNALQAMDGGGGAIRITTRVSLDHRLASSGEDSLPTLIVEVADTGPGIAAELLERVSTPFFTTRAEGTGLGLAVARQWIARHGGALRIESAPGAGTVVRVALPLRRAA